MSYFERMHLTCFETYELHLMTVKVAVFVVVAVLLRSGYGTHANVATELHENIAQYG